MKRYSTHCAASLAAVVILTLVSSGWSEATPRKILASSPASRARPAMLQPHLTRANAPVSVAHTAAAGQTGYVHFFLLRDPEEETETQIGIELEGERIAWSFPGTGVVVVPFMKSGTVEANGRRYEFAHLYGLRPFPDERSMSRLRAELASRVAPYVENETPYCYTRARDDPFCLSCLDFVARVLFPGHFPKPPTLPHDFERGTHAANHTTDDLLLYLLGLQALQNRAARLRRIEGLMLPDNLREDAVSLVESMPDPAVQVAESRGPASRTRRDAQPPGTKPAQRLIRRRKS